MKAHFARLFNYDQYANQLILKTISETNNSDKPVQLMAHLLAAQQIWLSRCKGEPATGGSSWPDWKANQLEQLINDNHQAWINFINALNPDDFEKTITYKSLKGEGFESKLNDILTHVINHGTHHRAQAGQHLKLAGADLPMTDYIFYLRQ